MLSTTRLSYKLKMASYRSSSSYRELTLSCYKLSAGLWHAVARAVLQHVYYRIRNAFQIFSFLNSWMCDIVFTLGQTVRTH